MADAVAFVDDLFFLAKMTETARQTGVELKTVSNTDAFLLEAAAKMDEDTAPSPARLLSAAEFVLEGLYAHKRISRSEERGFFGEPPRKPQPRETPDRSSRRQYN